MLAALKIKKVEELIAEFTKEELFWLNGYINGVLAGTKPALINGNGEAIKSAVKRITIAYGTETGNSKKLASQFALKAKKMVLSQNSPAWINTGTMNFQKRNIFLLSSAHMEKVIRL